MPTNNQTNNKVLATCYPVAVLVCFLSLTFCLFFSIHTHTIEEIALQWMDMRSIIENLIWRNSGALDHIKLCRWLEWKIMSDSSHTVVYVWECVWEQDGRWRKSLKMMPREGKDDASVQTKQQIQHSPLSRQTMKHVRSISISHSVGYKAPQL